MFLLFIDTSDVEQTGLELSLETVISGLCRAAGRLFHGDDPTTVELCRPITVWSCVV